jgi:hypothetical protein
MSEQMHPTVNKANRKFVDFSNENYKEKTGKNTGNTVIATIGMFLTAKIGTIAAAAAGYHGNPMLVGSIIPVTAALMLVQGRNLYRAFKSQSDVTKLQQFLANDPSLNKTLNQIKAITKESGGDKDKLKRDLVQFIVTKPGVKLKDADAMVSSITEVAKKAGWFYEMSEESQQQYLDKHPLSKYAKVV